MIELQLLESRLTILIVKEKYDFSTSLIDYQKKLIEYFNFNYTLDEIETALSKLEETHLEIVYQNEKEALVLSDKLDYKLIPLKQLI